MTQQLKQLGFALIFIVVVFIAGVAGTAQGKELLERFISTAEKGNPSLYKVVEFADGDTISVNINGTTERIRFIGIDTPEKNHPDKAVQCFAQQASKFTKDLIGNNKVRLEADPSNTNRDRYDRLLRYVYLPDGTLVNKEIVAQGYGFAYLAFPYTKIEEFKKVESSARQNNLGLWSGCDVINDNGYLQTNDALEE